MYLDAAGRSLQVVRASTRSHRGIGYLSLELDLGSSQL